MRPGRQVPAAAPCRGLTPKGPPSTAFLDPIDSLSGSLFPALLVHLTTREHVAPHPDGLQREYPRTVREGQVALFARHPSAQCRPAIISSDPDGTLLAWLCDHRIGTF